MEELSVNRPADGKPVILVGLIKRSCEDAVSRAARRERVAIARAYLDLGHEVYESHYDPGLPETPANDPVNDWPNDHFMQVDDIVVPSGRVFGALGEGGNYVCGEDFVLVSAQVEDLFRKRQRGHSGFRRVFEGRSLYFVEPYVMRLRPTGSRRSEAVPLGGHIDLTIGYLPRQRILTISDLHHAQIGQSIEAVARRHGLKIHLTTNERPYVYHPFVNNYFVISPGRRGQVVVANSHEGFDQGLRGLGVEVRAPHRPIIRLALYRGSIKCVSNQAASPVVFDRLGITCRRWNAAAGTA